MEGIGSEVSQKIRAAIKAKLIELGAYVDDELPDYIMIMVANKRTRSQMDEDLQLFLTSNTKIFTSWLHTVLQKLQEVTVANFENKKESEKKLKRKRSEPDDGASRKSSEEGREKVKKHSKKHKEMKKGKKNKHKSKEKGKLGSEKKHEKDEGKEKSGDKDEKKTSQESDRKDKGSKNKRMQLTDAVGKAILGDLKKSKRLKSDKNDSSSQSCSSSAGSSNGEEKSAKENGKVSDNNKQGTAFDDDDDVLNIKVDDEPGGMDITCGKNNKKDLIEDEFNIEPLKPAERDDDMDSHKDAEGKESVKNKEGAVDIQVEKTIRAPTEELLKEHDKIQSQKLEGDDNQEKKMQRSDSEESLSPEEMRKQLLLSRAKKKLEESKLAERMRSNSPDVLILVEDSKLGGKQKDSSKQPEGRLSPSPRSRDSSAHSRKLSPYSSERRSHLGGGSPSRRGNLDQKSVPRSSNDRRKISLRESSPERVKNIGSSGERKKNVIKISESLEMEKNLGVKKSKEKETLSRRRAVSSRVVTITGPEAPEIPSIVKVKPREYISKDKQANKALILKAVADAEKSIATVHTRNEIDVEPKKKEALFTKNLRGKRYEKLAVTLSNIRKSPDSRDRLERRVSVDSDKSEKSRPKRDSSDVSGGVRIKSDLLSKKISKSEDQFISSKTTIMENNDKYIRCWLEGVEKAVKDDEIVNPSEMDDFNQSNFTDEENDLLGKEEERKKKRKAVEPPAEASSKTPKLTEKEIANLRLLPNSGGNESGPQIVVTLDGLNSKTIKDLILRNKETAHKPISSTGKKEEREKVTERITPRERSPSDSRKSGLEKISDRFGRLNKANEETETGRREDKKGGKYQISDKEKKEKVPTQSKNRQLIAQLSEKFGKVDREFENKKRMRPDDDRRYSYESRRNEKDDNERNGRYRKSERRSFREGSDNEERRVKSREKCMFWPNCSKGSRCEYIHPSSPCKSFPNCIYKDRCSYSHPVCINGERCRDRDCPFEHKCRGTSPNENSSKRPSSPLSIFPSTCKFYPQCKNTNCRYFHPKKCRFDDCCTNPDCIYVHSRSVYKKFKWFAKS